MFRIIFADGKVRVTFVEETANMQALRALSEAGEGFTAQYTEAPEPGLVGLVRTIKVVAA